MKVENGKIIEATEDELYDFYLSRGWYDIMTFEECLRGCKNAGTVIIKEEV